MKDRVSYDLLQAGRPSHRRQIVIIGAFFFLFGFITWVNGSLIPYLTIACELKSWQAYFVTFAFYIAYTIMAFPSGYILSRTGMIGGIRIGLIVMAAGCLLFIPAALTRLYPLFLAGLFIVGTGLTLLQTAVNPYITILGPLNKAAQRISIMGICNKFAGVLAPIVLGAVLLRDPDRLPGQLSHMTAVARNEKLDELARAVIGPYLLLTIVLVAVAFLIRLANLPEVSATGNKEETDVSQAEKRLPVGYGFLAIFAAVGVEVIAGDTMANYGLYHGIRLGIAKNLTALPLAAMMTGYCIGALSIPKSISQENAFFYSAWSGIAITLLVIALPGILSVGMVALLGFANALLWPAIWPLALNGRTGRDLHTASALLITGIAGGALMPLIYSGVSAFTNPQWAYAVLIPCYMYQLYYLKLGKKEKSRSSQVKWIG